MTAGPSAVVPDLLVAAPLRLEASALRRGAPQLRVLRTGAGPARAAAASEKIARDPARAVAVAGVCGGLADRLQPGDVVVARRLVGAGGETVRLVPEPVCDALRGLGVMASVGDLLSLDHVVRGAERAKWSARGFDIVDMESLWLAPGASARPLAVVRVVVDAPRHEIVSPRFLTNGLRGLRRLREVAPALVHWAAARGPAHPFFPPATESRARGA